jgi:hypothetical protein
MLISEGFADVRPVPLEGDERLAARNDLAARYSAGASIRTLVAYFGRSYGLVYALLVEAGVEFRPRGGRYLERS